MDTQRQQQQELFFKPAYRRGGPASSRYAETQITVTGARQSQAMKVLAAVIKYPNSTSAEISGYTGLDRVMVARRLPDLEANGLVERGDIRNDRAGHRPGVTWRATEEGRRYV